MIDTVPDVHALDRDIPAGKVLIAEYAQLSDDDPRPVETVLDTKIGWHQIEVKLIARTAGWAIAGSAMRWDNGCFAVSYEIDGAHHGSRYHTLDQAIAYFNRIPARSPSTENPS
ncbi:MAG: hypothetical protein M9924_21285 [Rhizobiaceae bacterium]|nr:hypothetical protein [Rhizobiaceae bacterium]